MNNAAGNNNDIKVFVIVKLVPLLFFVMSVNSTSLSKALKVCSGENERGFSVDWKPGLKVPKRLRAALFANARRVYVSQLISEYVILPILH